jgi:predicted methyltransferase
MRPEPSGEKKSEEPLMHKTILAALAFSFAGAFAAQAQAIPDYVKAAIDNSNRPAEDKALDADRKPGEIVTFLGLKPGDTVVDIIPGDPQYFTHIFSNVVGPTGHVYDYFPTEFDAALAKHHVVVPAEGTVDPKWPNVSVVHHSVQAFAIPTKANVVWIRQNYHDMHDSFTGPVDVAKMNKSIYDALAPGGIFVVLDHAAPGTGLSATDTLHRIDPAAVKSEVTAAGFTFAGQSDVLANPADPHTALVFDKSIRGHTDQFIYKFQKP